MLSYALQAWVNCLGWILLGTGALTALAWLLCQRSPWAAPRRKIWRLSLTGFALVFLLEVTGFAGMAAAWAFSNSAAHAPVQTGPGSGIAFSSALPMPQQSDAPMSQYGWLPLAIWFVGSLCWLGRFVWGQLLLSRLRRRLRPAEAATNLVVPRIARLLRCPRTVGIGILSGLQGPMVFGLRRPILALPPHFTTDFTLDQQTAILTHELSHLAARDPAWLWATELLTALLWWNPLMWWVRSRHRFESEAAADEATLHLQDGPGLLAESLVILGRRLSVRAMPGTLAITDGTHRSQLARRVHSLLCLEEQPRLSLFSGGWFLVCGVAMLLATLLGGLGVHALSDEASWQAHWQRSPLMHAWAMLQPTGRTGTTSVPAIPVRRIMHRDKNRPPILARPLGIAQENRTTAEVAYLQDVIHVDDGNGGTFSQNVLRPMRNGKLLAETEILPQLQLSAEQQRRWAALRRKLDAATLELYRMSSGQPERGEEINQMWRNGLREIFTPQQYQRYLDYWQ